MKRYVILGYSIAALSAIKAIRSLDKEGHITAISAENHLPYSKVLLTHYIAGHVPMKNMFLTNSGEMDELAAHVVFGLKAEMLDVKNKEILLSDGRSIPYDALLIATGGSPAVPETCMICKKTGLRTLEDAKRIKRLAGGGGSILIAGGGLVGVKLACALHHAGHPAEIIVKSNHILSQVADEEAAFRIQKLMESKGIRIHTGVDIANIYSAKDGKKTAILSDGSETKCDMAVYCKGVRANLSFLNKDQYGKDGVKVDEHMRTSLQDIYAAGDVACTLDIASQDYRNSSIWPHAGEQGKIAGLNMAGGDYVYRGSLSRNALEILGTPYINIGITNKNSGYEPQITSTKDTYKKLVYKQGKLVGALLLGDVYEAGRLQAVIRENNKAFI